MQKILVRLAENSRVISLEEYYLTKLIFPISYKELEEMERALMRLANKCGRRDEAFLVIPSTSKALVNPATTNPAEDPFIRNK